MLHDYHAAMRDGGLLAEFDYLEDSEDFYWVPPGYEIALSYDSVKTILVENARSVIAVDYRWDTLRVYPLAPSVANFHGRLSGEMTTVVNGATVVEEVKMIESGTVVRRGGRWRLLSGQTNDLHHNAAADDDLVPPGDRFDLLPRDSLLYEEAKRLR